MDIKRESQDIGSEYIRYFDIETICLDIDGKRKLEKLAKRKNDTVELIEKKKMIMEITNNFLLVCQCSE